MMSQQKQEEKVYSENHVGYPIEELINCENIPAGTDTAFLHMEDFNQVIQDIRE